MVGTIGFEPTTSSVSSSNPPISESHILGPHGLQRISLHETRWNRFHRRDLNHSRLRLWHRMLTIAFRDLCTMNWGRKGALLMLSVVVFWAAMPASACQLWAHSSLPSCCGKTGLGCDSSGMGAANSCCQIQGKNPAVPSVPAYTPEQAQNLALVPHQVGLELVAAHGPAYRDVNATPLQFPPGGAFALRI